LIDIDPILLINHQYCFDLFFCYYKLPLIVIIVPHTLYSEYRQFVVINFETREVIQKLITDPSELTDHCRRLNRILPGAKCTFFTISNL